MARPIKSGLDYFPIDVSMETSFELFEAEHGLTGFAIIVKLWQEIYKNGYFITWDDDTMLLLSKKFGVKQTELKQIVSTATRRNIFNKEMLETQNVLTSSGIQRRFLKIVFQSRRNNCSILPHLLLLTHEETQLTPTFSTQRKEKESKVNKSKALQTDFNSEKPVKTGDDIMERLKYLNQ
jgi:hypothetical protein